MAFLSIVFPKYQFKAYRDALIASRLAPGDVPASELVKYFRDGESALLISQEERIEAERLAAKHLSILSAAPIGAAASMRNFGSIFRGLEGEEGMTIMNHSNVGVHV